MIISILANGLMPTKSEVLDYLNAAEMVVCCDGALKNYLSWRLSHASAPSHRLAVIGDGDSLSPALLKEAQDNGITLEHHHIAEQESNDLSKAVRFALDIVKSSKLNVKKGEPLQDCPQKDSGDTSGSKRNVPLVRDSFLTLKAGPSTQVCILGATGLREDHTLGNISLLAHYMACYPDVEFVMRSDFNIFYPMQGERTFASQRGQQVSLFSLTPEVPVSVSGLRYPIHNRPLRSWWEGTLNEALADTFTVQGGTMIVAVELRVES